MFVITSSELSGSHGIKIAPAMKCSVEECSHDSIMSASRMNSAVVIFLDNPESERRGEKQNYHTGDFYPSNAFSSTGKKKDNFVQCSPKISC